MKNFSAALMLIFGAAGSHATEPLPEVQNAKIEYPSPRAPYEALRNKQNVAFSKDTTGWTVAFDKSAGVIWSFAPDPSFPVVVKRGRSKRTGTCLSQWTSSAEARKKHAMTWSDDIWQSTRKPVESGLTFGHKLNHSLVSKAELVSKDQT